MSRLGQDLCQGRAAECRFDQGNCVVDPPGAADTIGRRATSTPAGQVLIRRIGSTAFTTSRSVSFLGRLYERHPAVNAALRFDDPAPTQGL